MTNNITVERNVCNLCPCGAKVITVGTKEHGYRVAGADIGSYRVIGEILPQSPDYSRAIKGLEKLIETRETIGYNMIEEREWLRYLKNNLKNLEQDDIEIYA